MAYFLFQISSVGRSFKLLWFYKMICRKMLVNLIVSICAASVVGVSADVTPGEHCKRTCVKGDNRICHFDWTAELYPTVGAACNLCKPNGTHLAVSGCQCVLADGYERTVFAVNRMMPGPSIQVCKGDTVVVDVRNNLQGLELSIHWHGILQHGSQFMDGVPMVTQCPINAGNSFRYKWYANEAGTYFWHSHSALQIYDGLCGSIIVRESAEDNLFNDKYDFDDHVIFVQDWSHYVAYEIYPGFLRNQFGPENILINGLGKFDFKAKNSTMAADVPYTVFTVKRGSRTRFRLINSFASVCPCELSVEGHNLTIIATDGFLIHPEVVSTIISFSGERYDFVIDANQDGADAFWIQVRGAGTCEGNKVEQLAILAYDSAANTPRTVAPTFDNHLPSTRVLNPFANATCIIEDPTTICLSELVSAEPVYPALMDDAADFKFYMPFKFFEYTDERILFESNSFYPFAGTHFVSLINGVHHENPPSPLLSQFDDINQDKFCINDDLPTGCRAGYCSCVHIYEVPLNSTVEIVIIDEAAVKAHSHPFHLHGHKFHVISEGRADDFEESITTLNSIENMISGGYLKGLMIDRRIPANKDTIAVPMNGFVILRFRADNPGFWILHCHMSRHISMGMEVVLKVGSRSEHPDVPHGYPTCGNYNTTMEPLNKNRQ